MHLIRSFLKKFGYMKLHDAPPMARRIGNPQRAQRTLLKDMPVNVVFDIGANAGMSAIAYRQDFPKASIYSFEPDPNVFEELKQATKDDERIYPQQLALLDETGTELFHINGATQTNSFLKVHKEAAHWLGNGEQEIERALAQIAAIEVPVSTIDAFCTQHQIDQIDLLKIDAQGTDLRVLKGADRMLGQKKIRVAFVEFCMTPLYEAQAPLHQILEYMNQHDYRVYDIFAGDYSKTGQLLYGDILFVKA